MGSTGKGFPQVYSENLSIGRVQFLSPGIEIDDYPVSIDADNCVCRGCQKLRKSIGEPVSFALRRALLSDIAEDQDNTA
jgi:hypothetical protein